MAAILCDSTVGINRLCSATFEQLLAFWATLCSTSNLGQLLPSLAPFDQQIDINSIQTTKGRFISKDFLKTGFIKTDFIKTKDIQWNDNKITLALRLRNLDSGYLSNGRLNPAVIRCNIEPVAGHFGICWESLSWHRNQMKFRLKFQIVRILNENV